MRFRKKPVVVEAVQWSGGNVQEMARFLDRGDVGHVAPPADEPPCSRCIARFDFTTKPARLVISTLEGDMVAQPADWVIRGVKGEFYPCKPDVFESTYEAAEE